MKAVKLLSASETGEGASVKFDMNGEIYTGIITKDDIGNIHIKLSPLNEKVSEGKILPIKKGKKKKEKQWYEE